MAYCIACGKKIDDSDKVCPFCKSRQADFYIKKKPRDRTVLASILIVGLVVLCCVVAIISGALFWGGYRVSNTVADDIDEYDMSDEYAVEEDEFSPYIRENNLPPYEYQVFHIYNMVENNVDEDSYDLSIKSAVEAKDGDGRSCIAVKCIFTNQSDNDISPEEALNVMAYQEGETLDLCEPDWDNLDEKSYFLEDSDGEEFEYDIGYYEYMAEQYSLMLAPGETAEFVVGIQPQNSKGKFTIELKDMTGADDEKVRATFSY